MAHPKRRSRVGFLKDNLTRALIKSHSALVDVSDNSTIIEIKGRYSREILMKGCSLDIHPSVFQTDALPK